MPFIEASLPTLAACALGLAGFALLMLGKWPRMWARLSPVRRGRSPRLGKGVPGGLRGRPHKVSWVNYPGLEDHPDHGLVRKYLSGKASGVLTFGLKGAAGEGRERGARFLDALQLFTRLVNIGDVKSLATHPASTTHRQLSPAELDKAGVSEDTVRLSVGIEHVEDLKADLDQALAAA
jgi:O-acetylhomoserine/O-acetylserine sulfhydrylase-like pyridoxal-dependent enzyme